MVDPLICATLPASRRFDAAADAARQAGAVVFRDAPHSGSRVRVGPSSADALGRAEQVLLSAEWWLAGGAEAPIERALAGGAKVLVEVVSEAQAQRAVGAGATGLVVRGLEGGGLVGDESTLVLLRRVLRATPEGVVVIARGGLGPDTAAGAIASGAQGVMLDQQLWLARECELSDALGARLRDFNPLDTKTFGAAHGFRYRAFGQVATRSARELAKLEAQPGLEVGDLLGAIAARQPRDLGEPDLKRELVPLGQDAAFAAPLAARFGGAGEIVSGLRRVIVERLAALESRWPWTEGGGIARANGTRWPIHQGPMAQVADCPAFARSVGEAGALPWLALANMPVHIAEKLVVETAEACGELPFGAGIIGLDANPHRDAHIAMLKRRRPPFVMVAAGTIEQAQDFERAGLKTYLHTPTPGLLRAALASGLRRFVLEGAEAGGHVGSIGGLALWQLAVLEVERALAQGVPADEICLVPAGGIGDAASSRAVAATLLGLSERGVACGVQMGTAYLMCREAVETGAIAPRYQAEIAAARSTLLMGETVSAPTRVLPTPAADEVMGRELGRRAGGEPLRERKHAFERDNLGGLRAAAKAQRIASVDPERGAVFETIDLDTQRQTGLFHAGQVVALTDGVQSLEGLHRAIVEGLGQATPRATSEPPSERFSEHVNVDVNVDVNGGDIANDIADDVADDIAIVGLGCVLPDAPSVDAFWSNLIEGHCSIREVPADRWDPALYWSEDRQALDKTYARIGAFVEGFEFDRKAFRVPPMVVRSLDKAQQLALEAARQALVDAGFEGEGFPAEDCAVILGNSQGGELRLETAARVELPAMQRALRQALSAEGLESARVEAACEAFGAAWLKGRAPITEDTMAGELPNCIAGRVASTFDLGGPNWVVDAACASSLAALHVAVEGLRAGHYEAALVGGVDCLMSAEPYVKFSKIGALSAEGSRPFDRKANGFVMGEGAALFVLMPRKLAEAQGRRIYAVIKGVGASSDGRGKGITAPNPRGQRRAIERAYRDAGLDPTSVTMFEAHGTGTAVGDRTEVQTLVATVGRAAEGASLGSVKSNIGHLKAAAGAAALLKTTLALHHGTLVPTLGVTEVNPELPLSEGNLSLQRAAGAWERPVGVGARRAGISAFGFGGTNVHVVLEERDAVRSGAGKRSDGGGHGRRGDEGGEGAGDFVVETEVRVEADRVIAEGAAADRGAIYARTVEILCARTGYEADEIEADFELEADLGVDTVKQAEIMAEVREVYGLDKDPDFRLADYPTLGRLADYVVERLGSSANGSREQNVGGPGRDPQGGRFEEVTRSSLGSAEGREKRPTASLASVSRPPGLSARPATARTLDGVVVLGASSVGALQARLERFAGDLDRERLAATRGLGLDSGEAAQPERVAIAFDPAAGAEGLAELVQRALKVLRTGKGEKLLRNKGVFFGRGAAEGKLAFMFPGQGSQYLGMLSDLSERFPEIGEVFAEADAVMDGLLEQPLTRYIDPGPLSGAEATQAFMALTRTEITQPAVLAVDIAILRVLESLGWRPDVVIGHSLGEYAACVAAGVMDFPTALRTVAQRGTAMANVQPLNGDCGWMIAAPASVEVCEGYIAKVAAEGGYAVCANKNCPSQTVIGGESHVVERIKAMMEADGLSPKRIPVSHAFHTRVVAAASGPLREHLASEDIREPAIPILSNVTGTYYPSGADAVRDLLAKQVAAPVEFIAEVERLYADGVRVFVEVGPKRAQSGFVGNILGDRPHATFPTNHPKFGGLASLRAAAAQLMAAGHLPGGAEAAEASAEVRAEDATRVAAAAPAVESAGVYERVVAILCARTGYEADEIEADFELEADLGVDTVKQAEIMAEVREVYGLEKDPDFRLADYPTLGRLAAYVIERLGDTPKDVAEPVAEAAAAAPVVEASRALEPEVYERVVAILCARTGYEADEIEADFELEADLGVDTVKQAEIMAEVREVYGLEKDPDFRLADYPTLGRLAAYVIERLGTAAPAEVAEPVAEASAAEAPEVAVSRALEPEVYERVVSILCARTGYEPDEIEADFELEADLGVDTVKQAEIMAEVRDVYGLEKDPDFRLADYPTLGRLAAYVIARLGAEETPAQRVAASAPLVDEARVEPAPEGHGEGPGDTRWPVAAEVVCTGAAIGLPGTENVFDDEHFDRLFGGENLIGSVPAEIVQSMLDKRITRLQKGADGTAVFEPVEAAEDAVHLAGRLRRFALEDYGLEDRYAKGMDKASQLACGAGLEALKDAGIPLVPRYRTTRSGKKVSTGGWILPEALRRETGVIFASAFASVDVGLDHGRRAATDPDYAFDGRFLLQAMSMGSSRFAEIIGALGPNTRTNAACASLTQAIGMGADWIRLGRCKRVVVISADDVTDDTMMPWVGSGFLASGAATTEKDVTKAALPFDARRNGTILGAGAAALVLESAELAQARGVVPLADLLGTDFACSAFHTTRLDVAHIAEVFDHFVGETAERFGVERDAMAERGVFVSHETFTPARGGSAAAEIEMLKAAFGERAGEVWIANTKGYTGHLMGAGLEDAMAVKMLQRNRIPGPANYAEQDPSLGTLRFCDGGPAEVDYAFRFAAGFGSQLAVAIWRRRSCTEDRVHEAAYQRWLDQVTGFERAALSVEQRVLRARPAQPVAAEPVPSFEGSFDYGDGFQVQAVVPTRMPEPGATTHALQGRRVALAGGDPTLSEALQAAGAEALPLDPARLDSEEGARQTLTALGAVDGVIHTLSAASEDALAATTRLFNLARGWLATGGGAAGSFFTGVVSSETQGARAGAVCGFTKSLAREVPQARVRVLDVAPGVDAGLVVAAAVDPVGPVELGIDAEGAWTWTLGRPEGRPQAAPDAGTTWLVTGGARGITARVVLGLAKRFGGRFVLTGRTRAPGPGAASLDLAAERRRLKAELKASGAKVTPMVLQRALAPLEAQKEIAETLAALRAAGAQADYLSFDVSDAEATRQALAGLGPVHVCIHGAGLEDSRLLVDKDPAIVAKTMKVKTVGAEGLLNALGPQLQRFIVFTSVSGRFGNAGQTDYAAANDALAHLSRSLERPGLVQALAIDWTAWAEVGMATRGGVKLALEHLGVQFLPPEVGARMVGDLIAANVQGEVVAAGALGEMAAELASPPPVGPVAGVVESGTREVFERFELEADAPYLADHRIEGVGVLPGVVGLELFARVAAKLAPEKVVAGFEDVRFERPVKVHGGRPVRVEVKATMASDGHADVCLSATRRLATGREATTEHFRGRVRLEDTRVAREDSERFAIDAAQTWCAGPDAEGIYRTFFHTGVFQVLERLPHVGLRHTVAYGRLPMGDLGGTLSGTTLTDPLVREMALQAAGLHAMAQAGTKFLPAGVGRVDIAALAAPGDPVVVRVLDKGEAPAAGPLKVRRFDVELLSDNGLLLQRLVDCDMIEAGPLAPDERLEVAPRTGIALRRLGADQAETILEQLGMDVDTLCSAEQVMAYRRLKSAQRRREWLAARVALKLLVRDFLRDHTGLCPPPEAIVVVKDEFGAPSVALRGPWAEVVPTGGLPAVSMAHTGDQAVVAVAAANHRIGIDVETIEPRSPAFKDHYFDPKERSLDVFGPDRRPAGDAARVTALWCLKEAATKALGLGFHLALTEIAVERVEPDGRARLRLSGRAQQRFAELGATHIEARAFFADGLALAETSLVMAPSPDARRPLARAMRVKKLAAVAALLREKGILSGPRVAPEEPRPAKGKKKKGTPWGEA